MQRRRLAVLGIAAGVGLAALLLVPPHPRDLREGPALRLAALDGLRPVSWLSASEILVEKDVLAEALKPQPRVYNVATGKLSILSPALPPLPKDTLTEHYYRPLPSVSPDGQWLLSWEAKYGPGVTRSVLTGERWRLTRRDGSETRFFPSDGTFRPIAKDRPRNECFPYRGPHWLPDSSGWVVVHRLTSGKTAFFRYQLATPDAEPESLPVPNTARAWLEDNSTAPQPVWVGTTPEGHPLFATPDSPELIALGTTERKVHLSLPKGLSFATTPNICGEFFVSDGPHLTPEGDAVLAVLQSTDAPEAHPLTFWRLPLSGDAAQKLATLPTERHGLGAVRLSPDRKHLLYWVKKRAYIKIEAGE